jgi:predicted phosphodiesterase
MVIAFISDIHANFTALVAAIARAHRLGSERILMAGDVVGGGPHPVEVIRLLKSEGIAGVQGNVDRKVLELARDRGARKRCEKSTRKAHLAWTARQLGREELDWLAELPPTLELELEGVKTLVVHGSPRSDDDYIFPSVTPNAMRSFLGANRPKLLVCGHSHIPFTRSVGGVRVINCGSVGRPVDGDARGSFGLAEVRNGRVGRCRVVRFAYPVGRLVADLDARAVPGALGVEYLAGIKRRGV